MNQWVKQWDSEPVSHFYFSKSMLFYYIKNIAIYCKTFDSYIAFIACLYLHVINKSPKRHKDEGQGWDLQV